MVPVDARYWGKLLVLEEESLLGRVEENCNQKGRRQLSPLPPTIPFF
jgi:hypothetical protein